MRAAVTTPLRPSPAEEDDAREAAARFGLPFVSRGNRPKAAIASRAGADVLVVLSARDATLVVLDPSGAEIPTRWSAGMGALRARRAATRAAGRGAPTDRDPFLEAADIRPGDAVLDCTLGLGADALVAAVAAGPAGRVVGIESSPALAAWVDGGLRRAGGGAARRLEVVAGDHVAVLERLPEASFDVVVFDPMFRHARAEPGGFGAVRRLADARPLSAVAVARARRVARRWVVVKDGAPGWDLARLGLVPLPSARGAHRYYARLQGVHLASVR